MIITIAVTLIIIIWINALFANRTKEMAKTALLIRKTG